MSGILFCSNVQGTPAWELVRDGKKTQTFRLNGNRFDVGKTYAYQPGRGKKAIGRVHIKGWHYTRPSHLTDDDLRAEGFIGPHARRDFYDCIAKLCDTPRDKVWLLAGYSVTFELVEEAEDLAKEEKP